MTMSTEQMFSNEPNELVETKDGRKIWNSRSCAVAMTIIAIDQTCKYAPRVMAVKRGNACPDFVGQWCLPCGYIDRSETSGMAALRETWEETGIDFRLEMQNTTMLPGVAVLYQDVLDDETNNPWHCHTSPEGDKQNITLHHGIVLLTLEPPLPNIQLDEHGEVADVGWFTLDEFDEMPVCFNHQKRIAQFMRRVVMYL